MLNEGEVYEQMIYYRDLVQEAKDRGEKDIGAECMLRSLKDEALKYITYSEPVYYEDCISRRWMFRVNRYVVGIPPNHRVNRSVGIYPDRRKDKFEGEGPTKTDLIGLQKWLKQDKVEDFAKW